MHDLPTMEYEKIIGRLELFLAALDCEIGEPAYVWAWDQKALQANWDWAASVLPEIGMKEFTFDDECYNIIFPLYFKGVRVIIESSGMQHGNKLNAGGFVNVVVNKTGIIRCQFTNGIFSNATAASEPQSILTLSNAIERYCQMRSNMLIADEDEFVITKILFQYLVQEEIPLGKTPIRLIPVWTFYHERQHDDFPVPELVYEMIHAITGEPIEI
jgi:hypothetical protein